MKKNIAIEEEDWIDAGWGEIVSCEALSLDNSWPWDKGTAVPNRNPWEASCDFRVKYANGKSAKITARGWEVLMGLGFRGELLDGTEFNELDGVPNDEFRFFNIGLMATVAKALSDGIVIPAGNVSIEDEKSGKKILEELDIPSSPVVYCEENDATTFKRWKKKWLDAGICVDDSENYGLCVSKMLLEEEKRKMY